MQNTPTFEITVRRDYQLEVSLKAGDKFRFTGDSDKSRPARRGGDVLMVVKVIGPGVFKFSSDEAKLAWTPLDGVNVGRVFSFRDNLPESIEIIEEADYTDR